MIITFVYIHLYISFKLVCAFAMIDRIRRLMEYKNLSASQFADEVEVPRAVISHILSGRNKSSLDVMLKIVQAHPDISMNWLLLGEGEMLNVLATQAKLPDAPQKPAPVPADTKADVAVGAAQVEKDQDKKLVQPPASPATVPQKVVEQIIIFYTDKTFSIYTLG